MASQPVNVQDRIEQDENAFSKSDDLAFREQFERDDLSPLELQQTLEEIMRDRLAYLESCVARMKSELRDEPHKNIDEECCDIGNDVVFRNVIQSRLTEIRQIEHALFRIKKDTYGICGICDEPIPTGRLKLLPYALHCAQCMD